MRSKHMFELGDLVGFVQYVFGFHKPDITRDDIAIVIGKTKKAIIVLWNGEFIKVLPREIIRIN